MTAAPNVHLQTVRSSSALRLVLRFYFFDPVDPSGSGSRGVSDLSSFFSLILTPYPHRSSSQWVHVPPTVLQSVVRFETSVHPITLPRTGDTKEFIPEKWRVTGCMKTKRGGTTSRTLTHDRPTSGGEVLSSLVSFPSKHPHPPLFISTYPLLRRDSIP